MNFEPQSIQLLRIDPHTFHFQITPRGREFLNKLDRPIALITIAGLYRTGKSYLVNRLIKRKNSSNEKGFKIGSTTQSVTKGLNVWGQPILAETQRGQQMYYILVDSEGLGSLEQQIEYDLKLLLLIFLLSSTVVYNSVGAIDEVSLDQLRVIVNLKKCIGAMDQAKPKFIWILRDFALQLVDKYGRQLTPNQYLENCLEETNSTTIQGKRKNDIRKSIKESLPRRQCFTLVRPTLKEEDLAELSLNKCKVRPQFLSEIEILKQHLISGDNQDIKRIQGVAIDGKLMLRMMEQYVAKINSGETPTVKNVWEAAISLNNKERLEEVCQKLKSDVKKIQLPLSREELQRKLNEIENKAYSVLAVLLKMDPVMIKNHKEFITSTQKINRDIKDTNSILLSRNVRGEMMNIAQENLIYERIRPSQLSSLKVILERLQVKAKSSPETYSYLLQVVYDILYISEQKSLQFQREFVEMKKFLDATNVQKKQGELTLMTMKHDYHQALKKINELKSGFSELTKDNALLRNQTQSLTDRINSSAQQFDAKQLLHSSAIEEQSKRHRIKIQQLNAIIKKLRQENNQLSDQVQKHSQYRLSNEDNSNARKQFIFQQKVNETWKQFQQQKGKMQQKVKKHEQNIRQLAQSCKVLGVQLQKERELRLQQQKQYLQKEARFQREFQELKRSIQETKKSYQMTCETMIKNDKVFRKIENLTSAKKEPDQKENAKFLRNYYQNQLNKQRNEHQQQLKQLKFDLLEAKEASKKEKLMSMNCGMQIQQLKQRNRRLQQDIMEANRKFSDCISQIEEAKEKERSLYQQSIVRLLTNIQRGKGSNWSSKESNWQS